MTEKVSVTELERILALPAEALKIELLPNGEVRTRTKEEWVPIALRMSADDWAKLPIITRREVHDLAAALIEKLGQGWIPVSEEETRGDCVPGKPIYYVDARVEPYRWWRFDLPNLPPPPERP